MKIVSERSKFIIIIILIIISISLISYFEIILKSSILIAHFFYFPSILACFWWKKKGLIIPISLGLLIILFHSFPPIGEFFFIEMFNNFLRSISLIIIGFIISYLSELISSREVEFKEMMESLRRSNQDLQEFAYVASHDLQEPLRAIVSFSQLLEEEYYDTLEQEGKEYIDFITDGAIKMNTLIKDLLSYSRITRRTEPLEKVDLEEILDESIYNLQESIKESGAIITHDDLPVLKVDKTQFIQLFQNLLSNAIKFRRKEPPRVHIGVQQYNEKWLFSVKDNGIGIDYSVEFFYFQRFQYIAINMEIISSD